MPMSLRACPANVLVFALAFGSVAVGCNGQSTQPTGERPTQGAVANAVQRVSASVASAIEPPAAPPSADEGRASLRAPAVQVEGVGFAARVAVRADEHHREPQAVRAPGGWAVTWSDREHARAFFARTDEVGRARGPARVVRAAHGSEEEDVWAPALAALGEDGFALAWSDPANGRVRFQRLDAAGSARGGATIVHEGLEMPLATRIVWNGSEYGLAVALHAGVYFARVDAQGARVGDGVLLAEGTPVAELEELSAGAHGFTVAWRDADEGHARHRVRLGRDGQLAPRLAHR
jgi:hypothetical protein